MGTVVVMAAAFRAQLRARGHSRTACTCGPVAVAPIVQSPAVGAPRS